MCGSKTPNNVTSTQVNTPPPQVLQNYQEVYNAAKQVAGTPYQPYQGQMVAPLSDRQNAALGTIDASQGIAQPFISQAAGLANAGAQAINPMDFSNPAVAQYMSPYTEQVVDATKRNLWENDAQQNQQLIGNAISKGAWGGDRAGIAQAELARQQSLANGQTIAGLYNQGYTQALGEFNTQQQAQLNADQNNAWRQGNAAYALGNLGQLAQSTSLNGAAAQLQGGTLEQQNQQQGINAAYQQYLTGQGYPFQTLGWLSNIATGLGGASGGTSTSTSPGPSTTSQVLGAGVGGLGILGATGAFGSSGWLTGAAGLLAGLKDGGRVEGYADGGGITNAYGRAPYEIDGKGGLVIPNSTPRGPSGPGVRMPNAQPAQAPKSIADQIKDGAAVLGKFRSQNGASSNQPSPSGGFNAQTGDVTGGLADRQPGIDNYGLGGLVRPAFAEGGDLPPDAQALGLTAAAGPAEVPQAVVPDTPPPATVPALPPPQEIKPRPVAPAVAGGLGYQDRLRAAEGGNDPNARNPNSSATGPFQFIDQTWASVVNSPQGRAAGLTIEGRTDPKQAAVGEQIFRGWNADALDKSGIPPTDQNLRTSHFLGTAGGPRFIAGAMKNPDAPATSFVDPAAARANPTVFFNADGTPKTAAQVYARLGGDVSGGATGGLGAAGEVGRPGLPGATSDAPAKPGFANNQDMWMALAAAGLGMMGGTSKFAGVNIGQGGLQGLSYWQNMQKQRREEANTQSEIGYRSGTLQNEAQRLAQDAQRIKGELDIRTGEAATHKMNAETERMKTARFVPTVGWIYPDGSPASVPPTPPSGTPGAAQPPAATGAPAVPQDPGKAAPSPVAPVPAPQAAPPVTEGGQTQPAPAPQPPQSARAWKATTEAPDGLVPRQQQIVAYGNKAEEARATKILEDAAARSQKAGVGLYRLAEMDHAFDTLPKTGFLSPGTFATERGEWAKTINSMTGKPIFNPSDVASHELLLKDQFRLGAELSNSIGGREPGFIVEQAVKANPGANNTVQGYKRIVAGLREAQHYEQDREAFLNSYNLKYGHLNGAEKEFNRLNPPQRYAERAIVAAIPQEYQDRLQQVGKNPQAIREFDQRFGQGSAALVLGGR